MAAVELNTIIDRLEQLNGSFVGGTLTGLALEKPATELLIAIKERVKNTGVGSDGQQLRKYSTTPLYASPNQFIRGGFNAQGKNNVFGNTIGDRLVPTVTTKRSRLKSEKIKAKRYTLVKPNYQKRKTMYLKEGYKELRDIQSLPTDITNMSYSGQMLGDYQKEILGDSILLGITTEESANKYKGNTFGTSKMEGRGRFLQASDAEMSAFTEKASFNLRRLTNGILLNGENISATITQE